MDLECASGTTNTIPEQLMFITPNEYQNELKMNLVHEPGHWKLRDTNANDITLHHHSVEKCLCQIKME